MGTNFFLHRKLNKNQQKEIIHYITDENDYDYEKASEILSEVKPIHIGKRSGGWKFLWDANNFKYFEPNKKSITEFLKSGTIYDEYGSSFTYDQFINDEIKDFLEKGYDMKTYYEEPEIRKYPFYGQWKYMTQYEQEAFTSRGIQLNEYEEFYVDNLRFTINTDFG
jgi:hypothetical protein